MEVAVSVCPAINMLFATFTFLCETNVALAECHMVVKGTVKGENGVSFTLVDMKAPLESKEPDPKEVS